MKTDLLLVEDLLLLLLDDKTGTIAGEGMLHYTLNGAVLAELALLGAVVIDGSTVFHGPKVRAVTSEPLTDPLLRSAYDKIAERPRGANTVLIEIGSDLRGTVLERLLDRGLIRRESKRTLGIFRTTRLPANDPDYEAVLLEKARSVLVDGTHPDARTAALVAVLSASGTLPQFHPAIPWSGDVYLRGKELEKACWAAEAVNAAITGTAAAVSIGSSIAISTAINSRG